jgi:hypothetical protein
MKSANQSVPSGAAEILFPVSVLEMVKTKELRFCDSAVFMAVALLSSPQDNIFHGSPELLATLCSIPKLKCRNSIRQLEKHGLIRVIQNSRRTHIEWCNDISNPFICRKYRASIPIKIRSEVLRRGSCILCGSKSNLTVDHIIAYSRGGAHDISNFQCLCAKCNREKWYN